MPTKQEHLVKYRLNKKLLNSEEMDIAKNSHYEWVVTISFYSVLHLIESVLSEKYNFHPKKHEDRNSAISKFDDFKMVRADYNILQSACWKARYKKNRSSAKEAETSLKILLKFENLTESIFKESIAK